MGSALLLAALPAAAAPYAPQDEVERESVRRAQSDFLTRHLARLIDGVRQNLRASVPECDSLVASCHEFIQSELALAHGRLQGHRLIHLLRCR